MIWALAGFASSASAAVKCQMRLGQGCNGPVVYEIQLCAVLTLVQGQCVNLCQQVKPICTVSDFDNWVSAYDKKGRHGFKGSLAESNASDAYDQNGQLAATSGNVYTVCMSEKTGLLSSWSSPSPVKSAPACPRVIAASDANCGAGTAFNGDPTTPKCITKDSYCSGGGSVGNYASTMSAGFQMVDIQNQHFVNAPGEDTNLHNSAATAGTDLPGLIAPVGRGSSAGLQAGAFISFSPTHREGAAGGAAGSGSVSAATAAGSADSVNRVAAADGSAFASKTFGMEGSGYVNGTGTGGAATPSGASVESGGWFGGGAAAIAGSASDALGYAKGGRAVRGLASDGSLLIEDPANYFLLSDIDVSLFKRVTAQCRKKERSLVLSP